MLRIRGIMKIFISVGGGASTNPCSETYGGSHAFSEIEASSIAEFYRSIVGEVGLFLSFHSYGQYVLFPYGHTSAAPSNYDDLYQMSAAYATRAAVNYGTRYTYGQTSTHLCKYREGKWSEKDRY